MHVRLSLALGSVVLSAMVACAAGEHTATTDDGSDTSPTSPLPGGGSTSSSSSSSSGSTSSSSSGGVDGGSTSSSSSSGGSTSSSSSGGPPPPTPASGISVTVGGLVYQDPAMTIRRNTAVGGGAGGSDGTSYAAGTTSQTPDTFFMMQLNSQSSYVTAGSYPCTSGKPLAGQGEVDITFFEPTTTHFYSQLTTCTITITTVSAAAKPVVTGTISGTLIDSKVGAMPVAGSFALPYSN